MAGKLILGGGSELVSDTILLPANYSKTFNPIVLRMPMQSGNLITREEARQKEVQEKSIKIADIRINRLFLSLSNENFYSVILTQNVLEISIVIPAEENRVWDFTLKIQQDSVGNRKWVNPSNWLFPAGVSKYNPTARKFSVDLVKGISYDNGKSWMIYYQKNFGG